MIRTMTQHQAMNDFSCKDCQDNKPCKYDGDCWVNATISLMCEYCSESVFFVDSVDFEPVSYCCPHCGSHNHPSGFNNWQ